MKYPVRANGQLIGTLERSEIELRSRGWLKLNLPVEVAADGAAAFVPLATFLATASSPAPNAAPASVRQPVQQPVRQPVQQPSAAMLHLAPHPATIYQPTFDLSSLPPNAGQAYAAHRLGRFSTAAAVILGIVTANIFFVINYTFKHGRLPKIAPDDPSGGKAFGFLFIPFFNFYWVFFVWIRLVDRINLQFRLRGLPPPVGRGLPIAMIIVFILSVLAGPFGLMVWAVNWLIIVPVFGAKLQIAINQLAGSAAQPSAMPTQSTPQPAPRPSNVATAAAANAAPSASSSATYLVRIGGQQIGPMTLSEVERRAAGWPKNMPIEIAENGRSTFVPLDAFLQTPVMPGPPLVRGTADPASPPKTAFWTPLKIGIAIGAPVLLVSIYVGARWLLDRSPEYQAGVDLKQSGDFEGAAKSFEAAGTPDADFNLALLYQNGQGVPEDSARALELLRSAADKGSPAAQTMLGIKFANGDGVPQDSAEAAKWYEKAASNGYGWAGMLLGLAYETGEGVPQDLIQADKWLVLVAATGDTSAAEERDRIERSMSDDDKRAATEQANALADAILKRRSS